MRSEPGPDPPVLRAGGAYEHRPGGPPQAADAVPGGHGDHPALHRHLRRVGLRDAARGQPPLLRDRRHVRPHRGVRPRAALPAPAGAPGLRPGGRGPPDHHGARPRLRGRAHRLPAAATRSRCSPPRCSCRSEGRSPWPAWRPLLYGGAPAGRPLGAALALRAAGRGRPADAGPPLLDLRPRRRLRHGGAPRDVPRREPAARGEAAAGGGGGGRGPAGAQPGDRGQHPERPHDHGRRGPDPVREPVRRGDPRALAGRPPRLRRARRPGVAPARPGRARRSRRQPGAGPPRAVLPAPGRARARAGRFGDSPRDPGGRAQRLPRGLPGPHRDPAPRGGGAHQGEAGGGGGDGGAARPRDPQPPGLDPRLGPGPDRGAGPRRGGGAAPLHHLAGVEAAVGHPEPLPLPGPRRPRARATRWTCGRCWSRR